MTTIMIFSFLGGVLLLLYGMRLVGEGLQMAAGARLRSFLLAATDNRFKGVAIGAAITALLQSSSATTIMLVGFVGSGLMGLKQTIAIILGSDIGTTLTVQILAFKVYDYAVGVAGVGILLRLLSKRGVVKEIGIAVMGFGFVFLALKIIIDAASPLALNPLLLESLTGLSKDPVLGVIIAALVTALLHSSAATLALAITAATSGLLTLDAVMPIVFGANIGTCISAITSSIGAPTDAKRVALAHVIFKVSGVIIALPFLTVFTNLVSFASADLAREIAYAHTFFNIAIAVIFLPFTGPFTKLIQRILPESKEGERFGAKYLDPIVLTSPSLALGQAGREALRLADIVEEMLIDSIVVFKRNDKQLLEELQNRDDDVDLLDREIKLYLTKLSREGLTDEQARREFEILAFSNNLENIGDVIDKNLMELAHKKINGSFSFSEEGEREIEEFHRKIVENFEVGVAAFTRSDAELGRRLLSHKAKIAEMEKEFREAHIGRLHKGLKESIDTSAIHLDVLTNLKRINSYISNVAYTILDAE